MSQNTPAAADDPQLEEEVISPGTRRKLQQCYEHGRSLMAQEEYDHDYANTMFTECVVRDPGNLVYVEAFLENLQRKYKNNKRGARLLAFGGKGHFKKAVARGDWKEVLATGPGLLKTNPWDVTVLRGLARACEAFHYNEVELRYLKNALDGHPKDPEVNRHCAMSLARMGQFDQAIACWHRVEELKRHDPEAPKMISALTIERARARAGYGEEVPSARVRVVPTGHAAGKSPAPPAPHAPNEPSSRPAAEVSGTTDGEIDGQENGKTADAEPRATGTDTARRREIVLTPRQKLERAIADFPEGLDNYLKLAELHSQEGRPVEAERVLTKALSVSGGDLKVRELLEDATAERMRYQLAIAQQRAELKQTREALELVEQIQHNLLRYELEVLQGRSQRYPQDEALQFQLGQRLKRLGNFREAADLFERVQRDPASKAVAQLELGECLQHLKRYPKALLAYEHAIDASEQVGQLEVQKLSLYRAGVLAAALRQVEAARRHFRTLCQMDPEYKDANDRLDKLSKIDHKE